MVLIALTKTMTWNSNLRTRGSFSSEASFYISVNEESNSVSIYQAPFIRFVKYESENQNQLTAGSKYTILGFQRRLKVAGGIKKAIYQLLTL